jgi:hypothetical protein
MKDRTLTRVGTKNTNKARKNCAYNQCCCKQTPLSAKFYKNHFKNFRELVLMFIVLVLCIQIAHIKSSVIDATYSLLNNLTSY